MKDTIKFSSYIPKIAYWSVGGINEREGYDGHPDAYSKEAYFISRQIDVYGKMTREDKALLNACIDIMKEVRTSWYSHNSTRRILREEWEQKMVDAGVPIRTK